MDEMLEVVANVPLLQGGALERAKRVEQGFPTADGADEAAIRAEFNAMFATV
jgi:beta-N-acetylhexosaminidase